ncbi:MAG TPA: PspA/IM30 family protein [Planctomycetaceae bacterium]|nr:PspA/IM30 family protein [Planctomycetaceae bacterium]HQZ69377.1 PspA/IM30 family protein [Planctomycetaceae bacterium]
MPHFSRLTDIITCSLTEILKAAVDPATTLQEIIGEMDEGLAACRRNVRTSTSNSERLKREIAEYESQVRTWKDRAKRSLAEDDEDAARNSLCRKVELEDLIAGLRPELDAADSASQHMLRIQKALEARHSEALRKHEELTGQPAEFPHQSETAVLSSAAATQKRSSAVEAELEALRREMEG